MNVGLYGPTRETDVPPEVDRVSFPAQRARAPRAAYQPRDIYQVVFFRMSQKTSQGPVLEFLTILRPRELGLETLLRWKMMIGFRIVVRDLHGMISTASKCGVLTARNTEALE